MIEIGSTIISRDVFEEHFVCDLLKCKGACCIEGDSGAPVSSEEAAFLESDFNSYKDYLSKEHLVEIDKQGFTVIDKDGDLVTPLLNNRQCVYSFYDENGVLKCAIEKSFFAGKMQFRKPVSCHLFPIRITAYKNYDAVNYQELGICFPGKQCGESAKIPLYKFLKEPLIRKYGEAWYAELEIAADYLKKKS